MSLGSWWCWVILKATPNFKPIRADLNARLEPDSLAAPNVMPLHGGCVSTACPISAWLASTPSHQPADRNSDENSMSHRWLTGAIESRYPYPTMTGLINRLVDYQPNTDAFGAREHDGSRNG